MGGRADGLGDAAHIVPQQGPAFVAAAGRLGQLAQDKGVGFDGLAGTRIDLGPGVPLHQLRSGGNDDHARPPQHLDLEAAGGQQRPHAIGRNPVLPGEKHFGGHDILAHFAHMLPGIGRRFDLDAVIIQPLDLLDHDDGIGAGRKHPAGVDVKGVAVD